MGHTSSVKAAVDSYMSLRMVVAEGNRLTLLVAVKLRPMALFLVTYIESNRIFILCPTKHLNQIRVNAMDQQSTLVSATSLRALTYRLSTTPTQQLPHIAPQIAAAVWRCREILSSQIDGKRNGELVVTIHRFKTQLSTLLQDRSIHGRWAAVVLVKATVEAGGLEVLSKCNPWLHSLLAILKKPGPSTTRNLATITLTRIFMLTWNYPELIREITTPSLPGFITSCLNNAGHTNAGAKEKQFVFEAFATLVPKHPTIFRTSEHKIRELLIDVLATSSSDVGHDFHCPSTLAAAARKLLVLLHHCSPKQGTGEKWDETAGNVVTAAHATCDRIFRSVQESWSSTSGVVASAPTQELVVGDVEIDAEDASGLKPWKGIFAGVDRLICHLHLITAHLETVTASKVSLRVGIIADLLKRILAVSGPHRKRKDSVQTNNQVSREERETLFAMLPDIHTAALRVMIAFLARAGTSSMTLLTEWLDDIVGVFDSDQFHEPFRLVFYDAICRILEIQGPNLSKAAVVELTSVVNAGCNDMLPPTETLVNSSSKTSGISSGTVQHSGYAKGTLSGTSPAIFQELRRAARRFIRMMYLQLEANCIPSKLRAQMDRVVVLSRDKDCLLASVANPPVKGTSEQRSTSLLPILARQFPTDIETELLLRPRLPPIRGPSLPAREEINDEWDKVEFDEEDNDDDDDEEEEADTSDGNMELTTKPHNELILEGRSFDNDPDHNTPMLTSQTINLETHIDFTTGQELHRHIEAKDTWSTKRAMEEDTESTIVVKRLRASSAEEVMEPQIEEESSTHASQQLQGEIATSIRQDGAQREHMILESSMTNNNVLESNNNTSSMLARNTRDELDRASDDSDFELPPLTMEPDTDPEDD